MSQPDPSLPADPDPRPLPPYEPALEECCGNGCENCVFDVYQMLKRHYEGALAAWEARHPDLAGQAPPP